MENENNKSTKIVYFDETGDDGLVKRSSDDFVLTSIYLDANVWQKNFNKMANLKKELKGKYGFYVKEEMHTKFFLSDKDPYRKYNRSLNQKRDILNAYASTISELDIKSINVIIDKRKIIKQNYDILKSALTYNIQRIENDITDSSNYIIITDSGRIAPMRSTAREIRTYNPIHSKYSLDIDNKPIKGLIEDILEKDSKESYFIQICDFISYFIHLYYKVNVYKEDIPNRMKALIDNQSIEHFLDILKDKEILNLKASNRKYGLVVYPK